VRSGLRGTASGEHGGDNVFQIVSARGGTRGAGVHPAVIDAAVILQTARGVENGGFGRSGGVRELHERMTRVTQNGSREIVLGAVLFDRLCGRRWIRIYQPEPRAAAAEFLGEALQFGSVAIGDGAVRAHEDEDARASRGR